MAKRDDKSSTFVGPSKGIMYRRGIPYRGDGWPKGQKARKQYRNLRKEKKQDIFSIIKLFAFFILVFGFIIGFLASNFNSNDMWGVIVIGILIILFCGLIITIGMMSINKFRKGYDIDTSDEQEIDKKSPES